MAYVYRHIRLDKNEPFYIGIGSDENYNRSRERYNRNGLWKIIATKSEIEVEILLDGLTYSEAQTKEKEFIALYGRKNNNTGILTNLTDGGEGTIGTVITEETRQKLSIAHKGNKSRTGHKLSEETRRKMSMSRTGKKMPTFTEEHRKNMSLARIGKKLSIDTIKKIIDSNTGKKRTQESKDKISNANKGKKMSNEAKKKMSDYWKGRSRKPMSDETKKKIGEANKKLFIIKNKNNDSTNDRTD